MISELVTCMANFVNTKLGPHLIFPIIAWSCPILISRIDADLKFVPDPKQTKASISGQSLTGFRRRWRRAWTSYNTDHRGSQKRGESKKSRTLSHRQRAASSSLHSKFCTATRRWRSRQSGILGFQNYLHFSYRWLCCGFGQRMEISLFSPEERRRSFSNTLLHHAANWGPAHLSPGVGNWYDMTCCESQLRFGHYSLGG